MPNSRAFENLGMKAIIYVDIVLSHIVFWFFRMSSLDIQFSWDTFGKMMDLIYETQATYLLESGLKKNVLTSSDRPSPIRF